MSSLTLAQPHAVLNGRLPLHGLQFQAILPSHSDHKQDCINVCPTFFEESISPQLRLVDQVPLREAGKEYLKGAGTVWPEAHGAYTAQVWQEHIHAQKVIYLPHTGQMFTRPDVVQAASLIVHLLQEEDLLSIN